MNDILEPQGLKRKPKVNVGMLDLTPIFTSVGGLLMFGINPVLVNFMDNLRYMDSLGRCFPMIYREMQKLGMEVEVRELGEELRVVVPL